MQRIRNDLNLGAEDTHRDKGLMRLVFMVSEQRVVRRLWWESCKEHTEMTGSLDRCTNKGRQKELKFMWL